MMVNINDASSSESLVLNGYGKMTTRDIISSSTCYLPPASLTLWLITSSHFQSVFFFLNL